MSRIKKEHFQRTEALLYNYKMINYGIENMEDELDEMLINDGVGSIDPGAECFSTNKINSITENTAIDRTEGKKVKNLKTRITASRDLIKKIDLVVGELKENEKEIIRLYYFEKIRNDKKVADKMCYIAEYVGKLRRKAVSLISIGLGHSISQECKTYRVS
jgi:hypothetical protein